MKSNLFKKYCPKWFHQLKEGDSVWAVKYGYYPGITRYFITKIKQNENYIRFEIERENKSTKFTFIGMYRAWIHIQTDRPFCSAHTDSFYHHRVFSDETVARHSLGEHLKRTNKKLNGILKNIQRKMTYIEQLQAANKVLKHEKTCVCTQSLEIENCNIKNESNSMIQFHQKREYQVDIFFTVEKSFYKVYQNGGWNEFARFNEEEFNKNFKLID